MEFINTKIKLSLEEQKYYYLSSWIRDNKDLVEKLLNNIFQFSLGQKISIFTKEADLLEMETITLGYKEKSIVWKPTNKVLKVLPKIGSVLVLPKRIPMIVKPKPYTNRVNGGYLINDVRFNMDIVKQKWNVRERSQILDIYIIYDIVNNLSSV
ncbi:hypothetical protein QC762_0117510 (mitochondrion) [Podospora pseudocomata]|uniref:Uncharacterized protein n=1 Tax=Podospora pseudocomata TaxID=2093779 RepID=A0ABR0G236_9PEZI|nr:hypothetical protein QC762_0117510 [Podospora pseudocomata]